MCYDYLIEAGTLREKQKIRYYSYYLTLERSRGKAAATAMEKKMKKRITSGGGVSSSSVVLPHDLMVEELLTRLPAKSLMRFKCVSKIWCSTILDPAFCKAHRARSTSGSGLLIVCSDRRDNNDLGGSGSSGLGFFRATLYHRRGVFDLLHHINLSGYVGATEVIDGLVCLYTVDRASICNVSTHEIMHLPPCSWYYTNQMTYNPTSSDQYYLGFDSTCKEYPYKLLRASTFVIRFEDPEDDYLVSDCEILTVGKDSSWRVLDNRPVLDLWKQSVYINGILYWWHLSGKGFIGFCFKEEEFLLIGPPPMTQVREGSLYQCRGRLALVGGLVDRKLELWEFQQVEEKSNYGEGRGGETVEPLYKWIKHVIHIPYTFSADRDCKLIGNLPTGAMLMTCGILEQEQEEKEKEINKSTTSPVMAMPPIVSYDLTTGKFENFVIGNKFPSSLDSIINKFRVSYYEEDISPLSLMISNK